MSNQPDNSTDIKSQGGIQAAGVKSNNPGGDTGSSDSGSSAESASKISNDNGQINNSSLASNPEPSSDDSSHPTESPLSFIDPAGSASAFPTSDPSNDPVDSSSTSAGVPASTETADASVSSSSSSAEISGGGGGMSANTKVAIAVPVAVGGALLIAAIIFLVFFLRRRKQRQQQQQQQKDNGQIPTQAPAQERGLDQPPPYGPEDSRVEMASATAPVAGWSNSPRFPFNEPTQATVDAGPESDAHRGIGVAVTPEQQQTQPDVAATTGFHDVNNDLNRSRTQSPFDDPEDTLSEISRGFGGTGSVRSAVSAVSDEGDGHAYGHGQGHGGLGHRLD